MTYFYQLQIKCLDSQILEINSILGVKSNMPQVEWGLEVIQKDEDEYIPFINYFLSLLNNKYDDLEKIGIKRTDITIWMLYAYDSQCNMEFSPENMYNLGKEKITLCVSCWDIHDYDADK